MVFQLFVDNLKNIENFSIDVINQKFEKILIIYYSINNYAPT